MFEFIKNLFRKSYLNIFITDEYFQILTLKKVQGEFVVEGAIHTPLAKGIVKNGEILKEKELADSIKQLIPAKTKNCNLAVSDLQGYEYIFYLPKDLSGNHFELALEKLIAETIPLELFEIKYDYKVSLHGNVKVVFVTAMRKEVLAQYYEVCNHYLGLNPKALEPSSLSLLRNIPHDFSQDQGSIVIDIDKKCLKVLTLWACDIFDSQQISLESLDANSQVLVDSIKNSAESLSKVTQRGIKQILVSGNSIIKPKIVAMLQEKLKTEVLEAPVEGIEKYKVNISNNEDENFNFRVVSGLALRNYSNSGISINLLYKKSFNQ